MAAASSDVPQDLHSEFLRNNADFAAKFEDGSLPLPPARQALVLACMDARLHPEKVLGIRIGACHCVRNAGGRASDDAIRSIAISQRLLGTKEVHIVHHTDCGMLTFTNDQIAAKIKTDLGVDVAGRDFLPFPDLDQSVRDDVAIVKASPLVAPGTVVHGYVYDVTTGKVRVVA
ncbi:hypothetical protein HYH03_015644 [Edaphochlamys debaryana]|uniref:Carbonic anhydrase n=1 Tax=Edaphochlamys debaryana TaxID=47281 RepID=A0A835XJ46_9CHLO|nr:hypothetical protein HYH03_015644 [Edaphochlamys debaryana]|eukprot:KAG2485672.1 hypothetical protein HYH03_015644 [Edaphochlamys debaryana]